MSEYEEEDRAYRLRQAELKINYNVYQDVWFEDRTRWAVCSNIVLKDGYTVWREHGLSFNAIDTHAQVVVPIEVLGDLSDEEIGRRVRRCVPDARFCYATVVASSLLDERKKIFREWEYTAPAMAAYKALLEEFKEKADAHDIQSALRMIAEFEEHCRRKGLGKVSKRYERGKAASDYDALFVAVGRRDGFKCAACSSVEKLVLDHVEPVALGGVTHPDNLQLLCEKCNLEKGERVIDYRRTQNNDTVQ